MKIITYSKIGYNHPSQTNWCYGIWKVDLIDNTTPHCMSYTVKENFGGEERMLRDDRLATANMIETKGVYTSTGTQKITGVASLENMESDSFINKLVDFINK